MNIKKRRSFSATVTGLWKSYGLAAEVYCGFITEKEAFNIMANIKNKREKEACANSFRKYLGWYYKTCKE